MALAPLSAILQGSAIDLAQSYAAQGYATQFFSPGLVPGSTPGLRGTLRENSIISTPHPQGTPANSTEATPDDVSQSERIRQKTGNFWVDLLTGARTEEDAAANIAAREGSVTDTIGDAAQSVASLADWADGQRIIFALLGTMITVIGLFVLARPAIQPIAALGETLGAK